MNADSDPQTSPSSLDPAGAPREEAPEPAPLAGRGNGPPEKRILSKDSIRALRFPGDVSIGVIICYAAIAGTVAAQDSSYMASVAVIAFLYAAVAMNLTVLMGWAGQPSVLTAGLLLIGADCWVLFGTKFGLPAIVALPLIAVVGLVLGAVASLPALKLTGIYLLLSTLALHFIINEVVNQIQVSSNALAGYFPETISLAGYEISSTLQWLAVSAGIVAITHLYYRWLRTRRAARSWLLIRSGAGIAGVAGVNVARSLSLAFAVTSAGTAVVGMFLGAYLQNVSYESFSILLAINFIVIIVIGGPGSLSGAALGAAIVVGLPEVLANSIGSGSGSWLATNLSSVQALTYAVLACGVLIFAPRGLGLGLRSLGRSVLHATGRLRGGRRSAPEDVDDDGTSPGWEGILRVRDARLEYAAGELALDGVSLILRPGKIHAVLGPNGAGKTTLLHLVAGFPPGVRPRQTSGDVVLRVGREISLSTSVSPVRRVDYGIGFVPSEDKVFGQLSVGDQLNEAAATGRRQGADADSTVMIGELLEVFPTLGTRLGSRGFELSGGERQQLAIACALARRPRVLVIDEATLGLAPLLVVKVATALQTVARRHNLAVLLADQNQRLAELVADEVSVLTNGKVTFQGAPDAQDSHLSEQIGTDVEVVTHVRN